MKYEFRLSSTKQKNVSGTANVLIDKLAPFKGEVDTFQTDGEEVYVSARRQFDEKRSGILNFRFMADITNGKHEYTAGSRLSIVYFLVEKVAEGTKFTPYPAVYDSGSVDVTFDKVKGTLTVEFELDVQNNSTEPMLNANGAFREVSGLEHVKE